MSIHGSSIYTSEKSNKEKHIQASPSQILNL